MVGRSWGSRTRPPEWAGEDDEMAVIAARAAAKAELSRKLQPERPRWQPPPPNAGEGAQPDAAAKAKAEAAKKKKGGGGKGGAGGAAPGLDGEEA